MIIELVQVIDLLLLRLILILKCGSFAYQILFLLLQDLHFPLLICHLLFGLGVPVFLLLIFCFESFELFFQLLNFGILHHSTLGFNRSFDSCQVLNDITT